MSKLVAPASRARGPHFCPAWAHEHTASRPGWLHEGLNVMRLTERGAFMAFNVFSLWVERRLSGTDIVFEKAEICFQLKKSVKKYIAMAEGEGTSFENPTFEFSGWDDDDYGDEKTPLFQNATSTPVDQYQTRVQEEMEMKERQQAERAARYVLC